MACVSSFARTHSHFEATVICCTPVGPVEGMKACKANNI